ncbi:ATP-binding protein [Undibacterium sp. Rencai35W]|uniref:ATP-binding protein n=1 Tax=Undibacterium sp. Rencai35W TaxID=3413046 RepID=UPI003BF2412D
MDLLVTNDVIACWEDELPFLQGIPRLDKMVALAWHLRQRDAQRAVLLADDADAMMNYVLSDDQALAYSAGSTARARLLLVRAEALWLYAKFDEAERLAIQALQAFSAIDAAHAGEREQGSSDAHYLLAAIAHNRGQITTLFEQLELAIAHAQMCRDADREAMANAFLATQMIFRDLPKAIERWNIRYKTELDDPRPIVAACAQEYFFYVGSLSSDFGSAIAHAILAYEFCLDYGELRRAVTLLSNIGDGFNSLNDHQAALQWLQTAHDLAKPKAWPASVGGTLVQMAETMRRLGRFDAAKELLTDALETLAPMSEARMYLMALRYQGDLSLDLGDNEQALASFRLLQEKADARDQLDFRIGSRRGQARALSLLGQPQEAINIAEHALMLAKYSKDNYRRIDVLRVLAAIHMRDNLPAPADMSAPSAPLHYLQQALDLAANISGYNVTGELLDEVADAQAAIGHFEEAFNLSRLAISSREKIHTQEATNRATAMQISHQTERMRAEGEHLRELANAEAQRAEVLQQSSAILERLGQVGQEITGSLDANAVFQALNRHVQGLLHVTAFVIYLMDADQQSMTSAYGVENGEPIAPDTVYMSSMVSYSVRCIKQRSDILVEISPETEIPELIPGTEPVLSTLFAPLMSADTVLGVMTIQSSREHAYGERERMIFRTLCAYGAIALANADAYQRLTQTQEHLVAQEKLAALGSLVAGVAHELNTPIGNCLLVASTLQDSTNTLVQKLAQQSLRRSDLSQFCEEAKLSADIMMRGLSSAATLVSSFKQVAVDRTSEHRRPFELHQVVHDIIATLNIRIAHAGHMVMQDIPMGIRMDSYPGSLGQVITNLIENAILHAFDLRGPGKLRISAIRPEPHRVLIQFADNGVGIPEENLKRIFDPFFTTKLGQGGSGLGLNICYNIVTSILHGQITVKSVLGEGTSFYLDLPLEV